MLNSIIFTKNRLGYKLLYLSFKANSQQRKKNSKSGTQNFQKRGLQMIY
jgi:hypothetical protein